MFAKEGIHVAIKNKVDATVENTKHFGRIAQRRVN